ncbi:acetylxylan esterase [candidate division KSB1 bacterium]|nr:acetylxylan esterase [candidate division KSB1 bacterium]
MRNRTFFHLFLLVVLFLVSSTVFSQITDFPPDTVVGVPVNYTEAHVGKYTLPDPLVLADGQDVENADTWMKKRRGEIITLFEQNQFGTTPAMLKNIRYDVFDHQSTAFDGKAKRTQVTIYFSKDANEPKLDVLFYTPAHTMKPVPLLLYISFRANSMAVDDPGVRQGYYWNREHKRVPATGKGPWKPLEVQPILDAGYGFATIYYGDIEPDFAEGAQYGIRSLVDKNTDSPEQPDASGSFAVWSWGLSRVLDYFEKDKSVDAKRVAIMGVSRLGKTVIWAGALDERFAMVIPVCSGESGAALSRRNYGETIAHIASPKRYAYWFAPRYQDYAADPNLLPVDAHMLLSLIAPRPLLLITGNTDKWSDPYGEFLAAVAAEPTFNLFGKKGLQTKNHPPAGEAILHDIGYYMHDGGHGMVPEDWQVIVEFMQMHLGK